MSPTTLRAIRSSRRASWNKGRLTGRKHPLLPKHVWAIRVQFGLANRTRDLALSNLATDSKLRGCDLLALRGADVYAAGQPSRCAAAPRPYENGQHGSESRCRP